jgi:putative transposase
MEPSPYPSDLSDQEWPWVAPLLPVPAKAGRPRKYSRREILDAIFSVIRPGWQWRWLPQDFPKWTTVRHYFRVWCHRGVWAALTDAVREKVRGALRRKAQPRAGIIDRQSVKTTGVGGDRG